MDSFLFHIDKWLSSTHIALMNAAEERGYLRLLLYAAKQADCGLPDDNEVLATISLIGLKKWNGPSGQKIRRCFVTRDGRLYNLTLLEEFERQQAEYRSRSERGKLGSIARWGTIRQPPSNGVSSCSDQRTHVDEKGVSSSSDLRTPVQPGNDGSAIAKPFLAISIDRSIDIGVAKNPKTPYTGIPGTASEEELEFIRKVLISYMDGTVVAENGPPDDDLVRRVYEAGGGVSVLEINDCLIEKYNNFPPMSRFGPRKWSWFPTVVKAHFEAIRKKQQHGKTEPE